MKKVLFTATVVKKHIMEFHIPYLRLFQEQGWETAVAAKNDYDDPADCVIPYCDAYFDVQFDRSPLKRTNIQTYRTLKKIIREGRYDIIHCHTPVGAAVTRLAAVAARKCGTKIIYTAHGFHFYQGAAWKNWLIFYPIEWVLAHLTDVLITINTEDYQFAQRKLHAKRVEYVPGVGVDTQRFCRNRQLGIEKRQELGLSEDDFVILTVAELIPRKNHQVVLHALRQLKETPAYENLKYVICGDGILMEELKQLVRSLGIQDHVLFLGYRDDIEALCNASDLFAFMSHQEGLPVALMEAMCCGLPAICSKIRGNVDLIEDGQDGLLLDNTPQAVADGILKLYGDPEYRKKLGAAAEEKIRQYDIQTISEKMKRIYFDM